MITTFDSSYAGHIDMENVGYGGTPLNDRWFSNAQLATEVMSAFQGRAAEAAIAD